MPETLIVTDLDGTTTFTGQGPVRSVYRALGRLATTDGVRLVIATSRSPRCVRSWFGSLASQVDLLCCNGALRISGDQQTSTPIAALTVAEIVSDLRSLRLDFCLEYGDRFVASSDIALPWWGPRQHVLGPRDLPVLGGVIKISVAVSEPCLARWDAARLGIEMFPHHTGDLDIVARGVSKAAALREIFPSGELPRVVAFGNDLNDRDLLLLADRGVIVGNGLPDLWDYPHIKRLPANSDAVAAALNSLSVPRSLSANSFA